MRYVLSNPIERPSSGAPYKYKVRVDYTSKPAELAVFYLQEHLLSSFTPRNAKAANRLRRVREYVETLNADDRLDMINELLALYLEYRAQKGLSQYPTAPTRKEALPRFKNEITASLMDQEYQYIDANGVRWPHIDSRGTVHTRSLFERFLAEFRESSYGFRQPETYSPREDEPQEAIVGWDPMTGESIVLGGSIERGFGEFEEESSAQFASLSPDDVMELGAVFPLYTHNTETARNPPSWFDGNLPVFPEELVDSKRLSEEDMYHYYDLKSFMDNLNEDQVYELQRGEPVYLDNAVISFQDYEFFLGVERQLKRLQDKRRDWALYLMVHMAYRVQDPDTGQLEIHPTVYGLIQHNKRFLDTVRLRKSNIGRLTSVALSSHLERVHAKTGVPTSVIAESKFRHNKPDYDLWHRYHPIRRKKSVSPYGGGGEDCLACQQHLYKINKSRPMIQNGEWVTSPSHSVLVWESREVVSDKKTNKYEEYQTRKTYPGEPLYAFVLNSEGEKIESDQPSLCKFHQCETCNWMADIFNMSPYAMMKEVDFALTELHEYKKALEQGAKEVERRGREKARRMQTRQNPIRMMRRPRRARGH